jgi:hypothetical protein
LTKGQDPGGSDRCYIVNKLMINIANVISAHFTFSVLCLIKILPDGE